MRQNSQEPGPETVQRKTAGGPQAGQPPPLVPPPPATLGGFQPMPSASPQQMLQPAQQPPYPGGQPPQEGGQPDLIQLIMRMLQNGNPQGQ